jgi:hypothetical protein
VATLPLWLETGCGPSVGSNIQDCTGYGLHLYTLMSVWSVLTDQSPRIIKMPESLSFGIEPITAHAWNKDRTS